ncbi:MAG: hypothetical protein GY820_29745 [Gammaproteobacteria bacterium]|nr:hypothetical protein [Gammaproteobacteria bacterium]
MRITFLGGADEIGASSAVLETAGRRILVDAGIRMNDRSGRPKTPDFSQLGRIDAVCLPHAHTDHSGALSGPDLHDQRFVSSLYSAVSGCIEAYVHVSGGIRNTVVRGTGRAGDFFSRRTYFGSGLSAARIPGRISSVHRRLFGHTAAGRIRCRPGYCGYGSHLRQPHPSAAQTGNSRMSDPDGADT